MRVEEFLEESSRRHAAKTALVAAGGKRRVSYAQLNEQANRLAQVLRQRGVRRGDRVVIFHRNSVEAVVGIFGALKAGGIFSVINPTTKAEKLGYVLHNCRARALLAHRDLAATALAASAVAPTVELLLLAGGAAGQDGRALPQEELMAHVPPEAPEHGGIDADLAMIIYTSGSTGSPKGVMMTHQNMVTAATSISAYLGNTAADVLLCFLPLSFGYGLYQVITAAKCGATVVLEESFAYPQVIVNHMAQEKVTGLPLVPTAAALLLQLRDLEPGSLPHLRYITNAAAALAPAHIQRLQELFPTTQLFSMYGQTECTRTTYLPPEQLKIRPGSVGKAIPNTEAYIADEAGNRLGPEEVGELMVRGGHVMQGYWENPEATRRALNTGSGWERILHSGDLFRMDREGYLYFVGRKDEMIKTRGEKVSPKEVESVLYALPGVREAAVVGVPDAILGMALKAVIVQEEGGELTVQAVREHCVRHLEDFMVPKLVEFRRQLPKTDSGKIRRRQIQDEALVAAG